VLIAPRGEITMKILISGAGIAGSAAALFMHRDGHALTGIDKAPSLRSIVERGYGKQFNVEAPLLRDIMGSNAPH
jgi:2-polyprenyl-6-methoxyphenol hydroxylase-like FAD-dependent oxidoreductase